MSEGEGTKEIVEGPDRSETAETAETGRIRALVAALRSGTYKQTLKVLARKHEYDTNESFCCLGVACEVARNNGLALNRVLSEASKIFRYSDAVGSGSAHTLPIAVWQWYGFRTDNPGLKIPTETAAEVDSSKFQDIWQEGMSLNASLLNDDYGLTLAQIGDCFEYTFLPQDWEVTRVARG